MKRSIICRISIVLVFLSFSLCSYASRPIWILGHGANYLGSVKAALDAGANGVEIDVKTNSTVKGNHWSVSHSKYYDTSKCDKGTGRSYVFSLSTYLAQDVLKDDKMRVLWIDVKSEEYIEELIKYVHAATPNGTPYSIIYNCYSAKKMNPHIKWVGENLRKNEGLNMGSLDINDVKPLIGTNGVPKEKHYYTIGYYRSSLKNKNQVIEARKLRDEKGEFCSRVGFWTCDWMREAQICLDPVYAGKDTNFDLILVYYPEGLRIPKWLNKDVLSNTINNVVNNKDVNKGRWHMAGKNDKFWPTE